MTIEADHIESLKQRFIALNRLRLEKTQQLLRPRQQDFIQLLPLLFHFNHPSLPGFHSHDTPAGLANYQLDDQTLRLAQKTCPGFAIERGLQHCFDIESLFLMGSSGSLAFSRKSDFDIWLCHRPDLPAEGIARLQAKATAIEQWADDLGLEVHFFLMNAEQFRQGKTTELSSESSGTAQHLLLLDEFYRTSLWVAGKYPLWWFIPPEQEANYSQIKQELFSKRLLSDTDTIDFGGLHRIPAREYFGAAVWQIYKGIDSPYKSALKITLMEAYAHTNGDPLSLRFKHRVHQGEENLQALDPYLMLLEFLENYLCGQNDHTRLEIIRRSFYIKLDLPLSRENKQPDWRRATVEALVKRWGWNDTQIKLIDSRHHWSVIEVMDERRLLIEHLTRSYQFLSEFARKQSDKRMIDARDLTILGRKLFVMFKREPGKIEIINRGIKKDISEESLSIIQVRDRRHKNHWLLFSGKVTINQINQRTPLKKTDGLVELAAWCFLNQVCTQGTQKLLVAPEAGIGLGDFDAIHDTLAQQCSDLKGFQPSTDDLLHPSTVLSAVLFINASHTPKPLLSGKDQHITSGRVDMLHYADRGHSLVASSELFYLTSWREAYASHHSGMQGFFESLCQFFSQGVGKDRLPKALPKLELQCNTPHIGKKLADRLRQVIQQMQAILFKNRQGLDSKFIVEAGKKFYLIQREKEQFSVRAYDNNLVLIKALETNNRRFRPFVLEKRSLRQSALAALAPLNTPGKVQVAVENRSDGALAYVLDEYGAVFMQRLPHCDGDTALHGYHSLLEQADKQQKPRQVEYFKLRKHATGYQAQAVPAEDFLASSIPPLRAQGQLCNNKPVFLFDYQNTRFSSAELGNKLFQQVAQHVRNHSPNKRAALLVSSLQLDPALLKLKDKQQITTLQLLKYKRLFEERLGMARAS